MAWSKILSRQPNARSHHISAYIFAFVFLIRLIALTRLTWSPFLLPVGGDMYFYDDWARKILHGQFTDHLAFYGLPLYAYLLALIYKLFGDSPFVPGLLQACLDAGTAALIYKISAHVFRKQAEPIWNSGRAIGVLAAVSWALFVPVQAYSVILMPTAWFVFVFWFLVWQIVRTEHAPKPVTSLFYGAIIGVTAMGIATILFIIPLVVGALLLKPLSTSETLSVWTAKSAAIVLLFLGIGVGTAPCWIHNYFAARDPVFLSAHSGINFWLGNNPEATGYPHFPGLRAGQAAMLKDSIDLAEAAAGRSLKRSEVSEYWSSKARSYISHNIPDWLKLIGRKLVNFWSAFEYDDLSIIEKLRSSGVLLPGIHFGLIAALAFPGICLTIGRFPAVGWIFSAVFLHMAAVLSVFVTERYRLAAVPGLILFAAAGLWIFWDGIFHARKGILVIYLVILAGSSLFVTLPQRDPGLWALKAYNSGLQALDLQNWAVAQKQLELACAYVPDSTEVNLALGNLWLQQQNLRPAESYYLKVLRLEPKHKAALNNLGVVALSEKDWESAAKHFRAALDVDPNDGKTHYLYARAQFGAGHISDAFSEIQIALRLKPGQREFEEFYELIQGKQ